MKVLWLRFCGAGTEPKTPEPQKCLKLRKAQSPTLHELGPAKSPKNAEKNRSLATFIEFFKGRPRYFSFPSAPDPLFKGSKAPFLTLRVAAPSA